MIGTTLQNRYRLDAELGRGGMGTVYRAHDTLLDRDVAVKVLSTSGLGTEGRTRLLREAQAAAKLNHPNIVAVYDVGEADGAPFVVMELVEGESLRRSQPKAMDEILSITRQVCAALDQAHFKLGTYVVVSFRAPEGCEESLLWLATVPVLGRDSSSFGRRSKPFTAWDDEALSQCSIRIRQLADQVTQPKTQRDSHQRDECPLEQRVHHHIAHRKRHDRNHHTMNDIGRVGVRRQKFSEFALAIDGAAK